jgi:hypothetical protein
VIKFGRVRFRVKKLVVDSMDVRENNLIESLNGGMNGTKNIAVTTLEDTVGITGMTGNNLTDAIDLRSLNRGDTMAGFDNRQFDFDDPLLK